MEKILQTLQDNILTPVAFRFNMGIRPRFLLVGVTNRCNSRCMMCNLWKTENSELPAQQLIDFFVKNRDFLKNVEEISITGGEPFLKQEFPEIVKAISENCKSLSGITIPTNGLATDIVINKTEKIMQNVKNITINIGVSIDGIGKTHDEIRGISGAYNRAQDTLEKLILLSKKYKNLHVGFGTVITPGNIHELEVLEELGKKLGVNNSFTPAVTSENIFMNECSEIATRFTGEEFGKMVSFLKKRCTPNGSGFKNYCAVEVLSNKLKQFPCPWGYSFLYIDPQGDVYPCHYLPKKYLMGNIKGSPISRIWFSEKANAARKEIKKEPYCISCINNCGFYVAARSNILSYAKFRARRVFGD